MYLPKHFEEPRQEVIHQLIQACSFGVLVCQTKQGLVANHLPFMLNSEAGAQGTLVAHIAKANPLCENLERGQEVLVIFQGPDSYISPNWYPSKRETGKVVPTWNYVVAHAYGPIQLHRDQAWLRQQVEQLTQVHESVMPTPWKPGDAPKDYLDKMLGAIVGIEIPITRLIGKWKLSQNQPEGNRQGVVQGLAERGTSDAQAIADWMSPPCGDD